MLSKHLTALRNRREAAEGPEGEPLAAESLLAYAEKTFIHEPPFYAPPHLKEVSEALERVERGELRRLLVVMPPRHGKSCLISESFPAWFLGRNPLKHVVHAGYAQGFTEHFGGILRQKMDSPEHKAAFPDPRCWLSTTKRSVDEWQTQAGGGYLAVGAGAGVSGRTGHLIVVDDPIRGSADADSELKRDKLWNWFKADLSTRQTGKKRAIVIVMTRWHEDDIIGRLEKTPGWDDFEVIHYEAFEPPGSDEPLAPDLVSREQLLEQKALFTPREWQALYLGRPTPRTGTFFKDDWVTHAKAPSAQELEQRPETMAVYGASDYATSKQAGRDFTVHMVFGIDVKDRLWVLDVWRRRTETKDWADALIRLMRRWRPRCWFEEGGLILKTVAPFITERMRATHTYCPRRQFPSVTDKEDRARSIQGRMELFGLFFDEHAPFANDLLHELMAFPYGTHDDQVDCLSLLGMGVHELGRGAAPKKDPRKVPMQERLRKTWAQQCARWDREDADALRGVW